MTASIDKQCVHKMSTVINEIPSLARRVIYHRKKGDKNICLDDDEWKEELFGIIGVILWDSLGEIFMRVEQIEQVLKDKQY
jgi:hypothetical protein